MRKKTFLGVFLGNRWCICLHTIVEHCIGILKSRWISPQEMRQKLRSLKNMQIFIRWVVACIVLHNMFARLGDA